MANGNTNILGSFLSGFQGAQQRAIQQAQQMEENALTRQLREIQLITAQRQAAEALKTPEQRAQEAITAQLITQAIQRGGVAPAPTGLAGESIALPRALPVFSQELLETGAITPQQAISDAITGPVQFETPVPGTAGAFVENPVLAAQAEKERIARLEAESNARRSPLSDGLRYIMTDQGLIAAPSRGPAPTNLTPLQTATGETIKAPARGVSGGLTANAQARVLEKAGTARISDKEITEKYTTNGVTDWNKLILDSNKKISEDKSLAAEEKLKQIPAAERAKATGFIAAHKGLTRLIEEVNKFKVQGREPDAWNRAVATALEAPPDGIFSALYQSSVGQSLTADEQTLNALKAMVRSAVTKANAGLSQTEREIANVSQYVPKSNDTIEETLRKGALLETYLIDQVESITTDPKEWLGSLNQGEPVNATRGTTAPGSTQIGRFTVRPR